METIESKTIFYEYSTYGHNQHFMTITQTLGYRKVIIGRIYKTYKPENKSYTYKAVDFNGDEIFGTTDNLNNLKNRFKKHGRFLAEGIIAMRRDRSQANFKFPYLHRATRENEIANVRNRVADKTKDKSREPIKTKEQEKQNPNQTEKVMDNNLPPRYKEPIPPKQENEASKESDTTTEETPNPEPTEQESIPYLDDEYLEREMELQEQRASNEDRDRDMDIDF